MDVYITWIKSDEADEHILKIVKPKKYKKNIDRIDYILCEYNAYSDRDRDTEYTNVVKVNNNTTELLFLVYNQTGQEGNYNSYITVHENMDSLISEAKDIYNWYYNDLCTICEKKCETPELCKMNFFENYGIIDYHSNRGECTLTWFSIPIIKE